MKQETEEYGVIRYEEVQLALAQCMRVNPVEEPGDPLHEDADKLSEIVGDMIYQHATCLSVKELSEDQLAAFHRWHR